MRDENMLAMQISGNGSTLEGVKRVKPVPGPGEVLVQVHAAGVTHTELLWFPTSHTKDGGKRERAIPGHEFSGIVAALGADTNGFRVGDEIYGMNDWFQEGATAEFCLSRPEWLAHKPSSLSHVEAASVPIGALTAWQGLFTKAGLKAGETVLVHGGAGAVGLFAVQLGAIHGAHVVATASQENLDLVTSLGANQVIDYKAQAFEKVIPPVDVIFDTVGGDTLQRSWGLLKPDGRLVTIVSEAESTTDARVKEAFFIVEPSGSQLTEVSALLEAGRLKTFVKAVVPLRDASLAYERRLPQTQSYGKVVIEVGDLSEYLAAGYSPATRS